MHIGSSGYDYRGNIVGLTIRNCVVRGNQGENALYISGVNGLKVYEGNVFYDNGFWNDHQEGEYRAKHIYHDNENGYGSVDPDGFTIVRNNIFVKTAAYAFSIRTSNAIINNYLEEHGENIVVGNHDGGQSWEMIETTIKDNVITHITNSFHQGLGYGINIENADNFSVKNNIQAYYESYSPYGHPFWITGRVDGQFTNGSIINNTIFDTLGDIRYQDNIGEIVRTDNMINGAMDLLPSEVRSSDVNYVDSNQRDMAKYNEYLGGGNDRDEFMNEAIKQWRRYYRSEYGAQALNDYVREGFRPDGSQLEYCSKGAVSCSTDE